MANIYKVVLRAPNSRIADAVRFWEWPVLGGEA